MTDVIALDSVRMAGLEQYLQGLAEGCRRRAADVAADVASTGAPVSVAAEVADLRRLATWCGRELDGVRWRRAQVELIPDGLPLPRLQPGAVGTAAAFVIAHRLAEAIDAHPPAWEDLADAVDQMARLGGSEALAASLLARLGGRRARELPHVLRAAAQRSAGGPLDQATAGELERLGSVLVDTVKLGSRHEGHGALGPGWIVSFAGLAPGIALADVEAGADDEARRVSERLDAGLQGAGFGASFAARLSTILGATTAATTFGVTGGLISGARAPIALLDGDGAECDVPEAGAAAVAGGLVIVGAATQFWPAALAGAAVGGLGSLLGACERQPARMNESTPTYDPEAGAWALPSGSQHNPHVDASGVPIPTGD